MNILIDGRVFSSSAAKRGMGNYVYDVISDLLASKIGKIILLQFPHYQDRFLNQPDLHKIALNASGVELEMEIQNIIINESIDFYVDATPMLGPNRSDLIHTKTISICFDLIPLLYPSFYFQSDQVVREYRNGIHRILKANKVVCISQQTKKDLELFFPQCKNIEVIYPRGELKFDNNKPKKKKILTSVGLHASKNYSELSKCITQISNSFPDWEINVIASSLEWSEQFKKLVPKNVLVHSDISKDEFSNFYEDAMIYIHASAEEGFGIPLVNAINAECIVVLADTFLNREIVTDPEGGYFFDLTKENAMFDQTKLAVVETAMKPNRKTKIQLKNTAQWNEILNSMNSTSSKSISFLSPVPPQKCGIADYSEAIILELAKNFDVNIFSDSLVSKDLEFNKSISIFPWAFRKFAHDWFKDTKNVYQLGAAPWFQNTLKDLISNHIPISNKVVVVHDRSIGLGLYELWKQNNDLKGFVENFLSYEEKNELIPSLSTWENLQDAQRVDQALLTFPLLKWLRNRCSKVLTHGIVSQSILTNELIPMPSALPKSIKSALPKHNRAKTGEILIGCFGRVSPNKYIENAILAITLLRARGIKASLLIVGDLVDSIYFENLLHLAQKENISSSVHFVGEVSPYEYWQYMVSLDYLVSLRDDSRGGLSAVLTNGLFVGKTILASDIPDHEVISNKVHLIDNRNAANEIFQKVAFDCSHKVYGLDKNMNSNKSALSGYMEVLR